MGIRERTVLKYFDETIAIKEVNFLIQKTLPAPEFYYPTDCDMC